jgi:hypothetical protein
MNSKIEAKLAKFLDFKPKRGASRQEVLSAMVLAVGALSDKDWNELDEDAMEWFNACADAKNAKKKELPDFPDVEAAEEEKEEAKPTRRRAAAADEDDAPAKAKPARDAKVGDVVTVTNKRGKETTGEVVEIDKDVIVLLVGSEEVEFGRDRVEKIVLAEAEPAADDEPAGAPELKVGDKATATNKRGKTVTGKIIEMDDELVVIDDGKDEHEFPRDRLESLVPVGGKPARAAKEEAAEEEKPARRGRTAAADDKDAEEKPKSTRVSNGEVSIGQAIREAILDDLDAKEEDIAKVLKKRGLEFKENTLNLNYKEAHKFLDLLKSRKMLKA